MKRLFSFLYGLVLLVATATLLFLVIDQSSWATYQEQLRAYEWFMPTVYIVVGVLIFIAIIMLIFALSPSHKKRNVALKYGDGDLMLNKKAIEKNVRYTVAKYDDIRQPSVSVQMYDKKKTSYIDIVVDVFIAQTTNVQTLIKTMRDDVKETTEHFSQLPVRDVKINVLDQKLLNKRVI
ncbi:alkaline shock response membrane anchor protein AmaP [Kurthia massiliensis]|uniref:alkaline shock response membrane anchor protein AmaP n=1 Tax=Kurthia massiliensis TaxID=1033739 RepID=UPI0002884385|nr:alkaline shock response membrane anchor protein AmaP [Kurthia massiliensis]